MKTERNQVTGGNDPSEKEQRFMPKDATFSYELQDFWYKRAKKGLRADRKKEQLKEAKSLEKHIRNDVKKYVAIRKKLDISAYKLTARQYEAFQYLRSGITQDVAAIMMNISQAAYSRLLTRLFEKYPDLTPTEENWLMRPDPIDPKKKARPKPGEAGSDEDDIDESAGTFTGAAHGHHKPGKTWWPDGQKKGNENFKQYALRIKKGKK